MHSAQVLLLFAGERTFNRVLAVLSCAAPNVVTQRVHPHESFLSALSQTMPSINGPSILLTDQPSMVEQARSPGFFLPTILIGDIANPAATSATCTLASDSPAGDWTSAIEFCQRVHDRYAVLRQRSALLHRLTTMEHNIVELAVDGIPNKTIATRLGVSIKTIEKYRRTAYDKLNVTSAAEMASVITFRHFCDVPTIGQQPASRHAA